MKILSILLLITLIPNISLAEVGQDTLAVQAAAEKAVAAGVRQDTQSPAGRVAAYLKANAANATKTALLVVFPLFLLLLLNHFVVEHILTNADKVFVIVD